MVTPIYNRSRSGSNENITSRDGVADTEVQPDALSSRLQNLDGGLTSSSRNSSSFFRRGAGTGSGGNTPLRHSHGSTSSMQNSAPRSSDNYLDESSLPRSNPLSRRTSEEEVTNTAEGGRSGITSGRHTPEHIDYSEIDLSRVPSYTTALRAPPRGMSYTDAEALPDYQTAISAPPSPQGGISILATVAEAPDAEVNGTGSGDRTVSSNNVSGAVARPSPSSPSSSWNPLAGIGLTLHHRGHSGHSQTFDADAQRRLHLLQARGRVH
jgi:hypothetical protein